jgi:hypothetical protein
MRWDYYCKSQYGVTAAEYDDMLEAQGACGICGEKFGGKVVAHLDHDHRTGAVREFLCSWCNKGIGLLKDDPILLRHAAKYLEKHNEDS